MQFKSLKARLRYIKKKAIALRAQKLKYCCVANCGKVSLYYAYITSGPTVTACAKHKDKLQPILQKVISKIPEEKLLNSVTNELEI